MSLLADEFRSKVSKMKDKRLKQEGGYEVGYSTGFANLDFRNGQSYMGTKDGKPYKNYILGLRDGSMNMIVGRSGCGKTTLAIQIAGNITRQFPEAVFYHDDIEGGAPYARRKQLLGFNDDEMENKYIYRDSGITIENIYQRIKMIYESKMEHYDELLYNTGCYDTKGNEIMKLIPTVYMIDSVATMTLEKYMDVDEMMGQMSGPATARANKQLANMLLQKLKPANIIVIFINHINDNVSIDSMPSKSALTYLNNKETLPGGKGIHYLQDNLIYLYDRKMKKDDKYKIDGTIVNVEFLKSRLNKAGKSVPLVFNQESGYDNELSILEFLRDQLPSLKGAHPKIPGYEKSFLNSNFKNKLIEDDAFADAFMTVAAEELEKLIAVIEEKDNKNSLKISSGILSKLNR